MACMGTVVRLGVKPRHRGERGLPKPEVSVARVSRDGLEDDYNVYRQAERGGDPDMAVLLLPVETLEELNREGWPVRPGDLGENVTTSGLAYEELRPPCRLRIGGVVVESSRPCEPCDNLSALPYVGRERGPAFLRAMLGRRGWFARVVESGTIRKGDRIELLPKAD